MSQAFPYEYHRNFVLHIEAVEYLTQQNSKEHPQPTPTSQHTAAENKEEDEKGPILIRVFKSCNRNTSALLQCIWVYNLVAIEHINH
ncbi:unnamed protein product [Lactuca virosa]|uniref:Uncharacterized protein n=1 Tax=Lactuca virosa TaxID=75947 RepID=A0AAU9PJA6_9ASTR|nr:unnamed protein product [Lactuca virosa]